MTAPSAPSVWYVQHYAGGPGIGRYHRGHHLARAWQRLGWRVQIVAASYHHLMNDIVEKPPRLEIDGVAYRFVPTPPYRGNGVARLRNMWAFGGAVCEALHEARTELPRVVIYSSPHLFAADAVERACRALGVAFVLEVRDLWPLSFHELLGMSRFHPLGWYVGRLERRAYARADAVVSLLPCSRRYMESRGLAPGKWHYIPNGAALEESAEAEPCPPDLVATLERLRSEGRRVIGYAGAMGVPNACEHMVEALRRLDADERRKIALVMVGEGSEKAQLQEAAAHLDLPMEFFPQMRKSQVWSLLSEIDAGIIVWQRRALYAFGVSANKVFDYFLAGKPVIQALTAGNDPVEEAGAGWSGPAEDTDTLVRNIRAFIGASSGELDAMGRAGRSWLLEHHEYEQLARRYDSLLRTVSADRIDVSR